MLTIIIVVGLLVIINLAAIVGVDSRDTLPDDHQRQWSEGF
jgi:hypothetical protein